jgi:transcriptional regulator
VYLPKRFENENLEDAFELIQKNPLATIISSTEQGPFVSHVPLILEKQPAGLTLIGHLARGNPHWKLLDDKSVYVIFHGPNAYMTPKWYEKNDVPTWSYAVVHINGTSSLIQDLDGIMTCLKKLSNAAEGNSKDPWDFWIPDDLAAPGAIERSIVGFEIRISDIKSKFKLNQTLSKASIEGCVQGLLSQKNDMNKELAEMMARSWKAFHDKRT